MAAVKRQVVIDTDIGIDDAFAILLALLDPTVEVIAITCLSGNVHIEGIISYLIKFIDLNS
jgi:inosine-uridine nucleoside N-ribohydrolase